MLYTIHNSSSMLILDSPAEFEETETLSKALGLFALLSVRSIFISRAVPRCIITLLDTSHIR